MPVEIKELVIRAVVTPDKGSPAPAPGAQASTITSEQREAIVEAAVREVLRILRAAKER